MLLQAGALRAKVLIQLYRVRTLLATIIDGSMFTHAVKENDDSDTRAKLIQRLML
jgi:hypothetical protein